MAKHPLQDLGRRERQIMEIVHRLGRASAVEVLEELPDPPSYSAVRGMLRYLEAKGHLRHRRVGVRNVYHPTAPREQIRRSALSELVRTFFNDSPSRVVAALLELPDREVSEAELRRLEQLVARMRKAR